MIIDLAPGEQTLKVVRKHWLTLIPQLLGLFMLFVAPFVLLVISSSIETDMFNFASVLESHRNQVNFIIVFWFVFLWFQLFHIWTDFYLDKWIITNRRIIDIEQKGFFSRQVSNFRIDRIQDITTNVHGLVPTFLNFGDINVQTAGEGGNFIIPTISRPTELKEFISRLQEAAIKAHQPV